MQSITARDPNPTWKHGALVLAATIIPKVGLSDGMQRMEPVIIVHGTFADKATWWKPDGDFCRFLDDQLKQRGSKAKCWDSIPAAEAISEFGWSGLNSEASRSHAAELLSRKIVRLSRKPLIKKIHFVAHSHGGNVLLKSLLLCRSEISYTKLGSVVFLGTPFFEYSSLNPKGAFWREIRRIVETDQRLQIVRSLQENRFYVIQSQHDEAYQLLSRAIHLRSSAYACSRKLRPRRVSGFPLPPRSLSPLTLLKMRYGRFGIVNIRNVPRSEDLIVDAPQKGPFIQLAIGRRDALRLAPGLAVHYVKEFLLSICAPLISVARRFGQRWGIYFGIKAMMSTALGDDLAFERILSVDRNTDLVPATVIALDRHVEEALLSAAVHGTDEILANLYRSISFAPSELELESLTELVSEVFKAKQIVHSQYYQNETVIEIVARAICDRIANE
ncbi:esterase/lipase family protein [Bradyrhizobium japonicum]|uniref:esterase/lipase family protein n=1 Tax=Bradyrhizobium japonicum TaxID=375 RepID=UPI00209F81D7|nr:hypothetical protein [Bradyrhizobium japonicum]MCP1805984.1 hypothetical protein [Bradyrhizobium japonicum]MCP1941546.1 hypothetical protein [Bradyrhizobium japonicum]